MCTALSVGVCISSFNSSHGCCAVESSTETQSTSDGKFIRIADIKDIVSKKVNFKNTNNPSIIMSAIVHFPQNFRQDQTYKALIVSHPGGGVKEQTAGTYARMLAAKGLVAIAYDASYQGESTGEPRHLENPYIRTEDVSAILDYLTTLPYVDAEKIGAMGICAGGGYTANAAINDHRIKAVGTVSAVNIGSMFRNGWENSVKDAEALPYLLAGSSARTHDASGAPIVTIPLAPLKAEDAPNEELRQAWEYYHTPRAEISTAPGVATSRSLTQIISYDAYNKAEAFFTQPLLMVVGSKAGSKWMSDDLIKRAASEEKSLHIVEGANHMELYDIRQYVEQAVEALATFFNDKL